MIPRCIADLVESKLRRPQLWRKEKREGGAPEIEERRRSTGAPSSQNCVERLEREEGNNGENSIGDRRWQKPVVSHLMGLLWVFDRKEGEAGVSLFITCLINFNLNGKCS